MLMTRNSIQRIQLALKKGPPQGEVAQLAEGTSSVIKSLLTEAL